ncbi:MAG: DUF1501 domain-containing protein [Pirellulaceae bacterium]
MLHSQHAHRGGQSRSRSRSCLAELRFQGGQPSAAWTNYGLGHETESLPSFVVMTSVTKNTTCGQIFYDFYWGSGFLPSKFQGVKFRSSGQPVLYLEDPPGIDRQRQRDAR